MAHAPTVLEHGSRGLVGGPSCREILRSIGCARIFDEQRYELFLGTTHREPLVTEELTHTTQTSRRPPSAKPAARGWACRAVQGARRAWRSSASERCHSESSRRSRRPGQFSLCNGVVDSLGFTGPRGDRPPRLAAIFACTTRSSGG